MVAGAGLCVLALGLAVGGRGSAETLPLSGHVIVVPITGEIDLGLAPYVERVLNGAGPTDLIVLDIDTFGGRIDAAVRIRAALLHTHAKTAAFIDPRAISAGALISLATDTIIMTEGGTIGAATPVELSGGKMNQVDAKVVSYFSKEMRATAEAKGRRGDIAEAMVDPSVEIAGLDGPDTTLTLTSAEAIKYNVAAFLAPNLDAVVHKLSPAAPLVHTNMNWAERLASLLSDSTVSSILMTLGILGILIELWAPGHAVAGLVGALCLAAFFFGHYVVHLAGLEEILLFGGGAAMIATELIFFPGHGVVVIGGALAVIASLVLALVGARDVSMPMGVAWSLGWLPHALTTVFGSLLAAIGAMVVASRFLPQTRLGRRLVLSDAVHANAQTNEGDLLLGREGVTQTALRPAGKADFGSERLDVTSDGGFIDAGQPVVVTLVDGPRIVVTKKA